MAFTVVDFVLAANFGAESSMVNLEGLPNSATTLETVAAPAAGTVIVHRSVNAS